MPMKIGIDASRVALEQKTGTENYTFRLIESIKNLDLVNKYILYFNKTPKYFEISQNNVSTRVIPMTRFWTQFRLAIECLLNPPDILFVPAHTIPVIRRSGMKTIVTVHDLGAEFLAEYHQFPQKLYLNWSTKYVAKFATHLIAVSEATKKDLVREMNVDPKRITVVPEAVDLGFYYERGKNEVEQVKKELGITKNYLLFIGTIQPRKNLLRLIEAFSKIGDKKLELILAGKPGWLFEEIYAAPKKFGIEDRVKFVGYVKDEQLPALYSGAEAFVFPSLYEGFGLPILESMACGVPVLTSRTSSMPEVSGGNAVLVNPNKTSEITRGIQTLIKDRSLYKKLSDSGKRWANQFTWERTARETIGVFERVGKKSEK
jgi:glycosyltransferase involved in cell wall biosynthesis